MTGTCSLCGQDIIWVEESGRWSHGLRGIGVEHEGVPLPQQA